MSVVLYIVIGLVALFVLAQVSMMMKMRAKKGKPAPQVNGKAGRAVQQGEKSLFYFFSPSCRACRYMTPYMQEMAKKNKNVFNVDISKDMQTAQKFGVMGTPSVVLVQGGTIQEFLVGAQSESRITTLLES